MRHAGLCQTSGDHGPGARDSQSGHRHASGQEGRLFEKDSRTGAVTLIQRIGRHREFLSLPGGLVK